MRLKVCFFLSILIIIFSQFFPTVAEAVPGNGHYLIAAAIQNGGPTSQNITFNNVTSWWNQAPTGTGSITLRDASSTVTTVTYTHVDMFCGGTNGLGTNASTIYPSLVTVGFQFASAACSPIGLKLEGLDPNHTYNIRFYASRAGVADMRTADYTVGTTTVTLNASGNVDNYVSISNISPTATGTIPFQVSKSASNTQGFYYFNLFDVTINNNAPVVSAGSNESITIPTSTVTLSGSVSDPESDAVTYSWSEVSSSSAWPNTFDNKGGATFSTTTTLTPVVRDLIPGVYTFKLTATDSFGLVASSTKTVTVSPGASTTSCPAKKVVFVGSSTTEGTGAHTGYSYVSLLTTYLQGLSANHSTVNLGASGEVTYQKLPTGSTIPANRPSVDTSTNITNAINRNPNAIVLNMPSNDVASGYSVSESQANFTAITNAAAAAHIPIWVTTTQPRNFAAAASTTDQITMRDWITSTYGSRAIDFWTTLANADGSFNETNTGGDWSLVGYGNGSGLHLNDRGHQLVAARVIDSGMFETICTNQVPVADAGSDQNIALPTTSASLAGTASETDGAISSYLWSQTAGPVSGTIVSPTASSTLVTGLSSSGTYTFRFVATDLWGQSATSTMDVDVTVAAPSVTTSAASSVATSTLTLNGAITSTGGSDATQSGFAYGTVANLSTVIATSTLGSQTGTTTFSQNLTGLTPGTIYYFRAYATNTQGTSFGSIVSTTTLAVSEPTVTTNAVSGETETTATLNGSLDAIGLDIVTTRGFEWGTTASYGATTTEDGAFGTGDFDAAITSLVCGTTYHYRAYAENTAGTAFGDDEAFMTADCPVVDSGSSTSGSVGSSQSQNQNQTNTVPVAPTSTIYPASNLINNVISFFTDEPTPVDTSEEDDVPAATTDQDLLNLTVKFPGISKMFDELGISKVADLFKLKDSNINVPVLFDRKNLPSDVVVAEAKNGLVPLNSFIILNEEGDLQQKINLVQGETLTLSVKPGSPAASINGYLMFKSNSQKSALQVPLNSMAASAFFAHLAMEKTTQTAPVIETGMLVRSFEYTDPDHDGIYTSEITAPANDGLYEILTVINYKDAKKGSKELRMVTVVDPEGYVYTTSAAGETRLANAKVTIWNADDSKWAAENYGQVNPQLTDSTGQYTFLVTAGKYYLTAEAEGYKPYRSEIFEVKDGNGVHFNIEMKPAWSWFKALADWKIIAIIVLVIAVIVGLKLRRL